MSRTPKNKRQTKKLSINNSAFYKVESRKKLAKLLFCSENNLQRLCKESETLYIEWATPKKNGTLRQIESPRSDLKQVQSRIATLLSRIEVPPYLMAPVKGRSYVDNALMHREGPAFRLLDIEDFFSNCRAPRVFWFFHKRMQCSRDVSAILTRLLTRHGRLPQGSPASPIMAYYAYLDMWEDINSAVEDARCKLSIYIDDITISGKKIPEALIWNVKSLLRKFRHQHKRAKERAVIHRPAEITGVIVNPGKSISLPNRQHKSLHELRKMLSRIKSPTLLKSVQNKIRGRVAQATQVLSRETQAGS
jgi:retron-type reverse transcriptase